MGNFELDVFNKGKNRKCVIDLIRRTLRFLAKNLGLRNSFKVRTGSNLCGINGMEIAISYDSHTNIAEYHLNYGDAYVEVDGNHETMTQCTSRTVSNGILSAERPLRQSNWSKILTYTAMIWPKP